MIREALLFVLDVLNQYIPPLNNASMDDLIVLGNIAMVDAYNDSANDGLENRIIVSVVNIEEEPVFRNAPSVVRGTGVNARELAPPVFMNVYILFAANNTKYENALHYISRVIGFFQNNKVFRSDGRFVMPDGGILTPNEAFPLGVEKMIFDLYSMNFEQLNQLWSIMGGKYVPSVVFKVRMLPIQESVGKAASIVCAIESEEKVGG